MKKQSKLANLRSHLMTGVSYMVPIVVIGGVLISLAIAFSGIQAGEGAVITHPFLMKMEELGGLALGLMVPVLSGYIAYGVSGRVGLAPGLVGGALSDSLGTGFLGGIVTGLLAGYVSKWLRDRKVPDVMKSLMPILVIPLVTTAVIGVVMFIIGSPISLLMETLTEALRNMSSTNAILLGSLMGAMTAFDMGGPIDKVAFMFAVTMIGEGVYTPMGPVAVAAAISPLAMGLASFLAPKKYTAEEREAGKGAVLMGAIGITEGAIPFAAGDPLRVIPSMMAASAIGGTIAAIAKVEVLAPHGGLIVLPVVNNKLMYIVAIAVGAIVGALLVNFLKKEIVEEEVEDSTFEEIEIDIIIE